MANMFVYKEQVDLLSTWYSEKIDEIVGLEHDLDGLVRAVLNAKDLERLKETTLMNYPEYKDA